ncbi:MAG: hypothetical protein P4L99_30070 [Chthoniobacter sp.]|nr:hypothetical protein [Chthoniobacter sp.]
MLPLDLAVVTSETFAPAIGQTFEAVFSDGRLPLTLAEVRPLGAARTPEVRAPFALTFHGQPKLHLPQRIYRLENATLGEMEIFLVQIAGTADASKIEAIFN